MGSDDRALATRKPSSNWVTHTSVPRAPSSTLPAWSCPTLTMPVACTVPPKLRSSRQVGGSELSDSGVASRALDTVRAASVPESRFPLTIAAAAAIKPKPRPSPHTRRMA